MDHGWKGDPPPVWRDRLAEIKARALATADALAGYPALKRQFEAETGYVPDLANPRTVSEKITWRKLRDRDPRYPFVADKLRVRAYVADRLGEAAVVRLFPRLHLAAARARDIDLRHLPPNLAIKANHASGWNMFLREGEPVDEERLRRICAHWLRRTYAPHKHEWAYRQIPRRILFEDLVLTPDGGAPDDVKFHMYDGVCRRCTVERRGPDGIAARHYAPDWSDHPTANAGRSGPSFLPRRPAPKRLEEMLAVARALSGDFDYLRVDFLDLGPRFVMTELTLYPASGMGGRQYDQDVELARHWRNPRWAEAA